MNHSKPSSRPGFGILLVGMIAFTWAAGLARGWEFIPYRGWGLAITFGLWAGFVLAAFGIDYVLFKTGLGQPVRSGLWLGAILGPYAGLAAQNTWDSPITAQVIGILATLAFFTLGYYLERRAYPSG